MKKLLISLLFIGSLLNASDNSSSVERKVDKEKEAYEAYIKSYESPLKLETKELLKDYLLSDLINIVNVYNTISYEQWQKNNNDLFEAIRHNSINKAKELIESGQVYLDFKKNNRTFLMNCAICDHLYIAHLLIENGADLNFQGGAGYTALMWAVDFGHFDLAKLLINAGANVNLINKENQSALTLAEQKYESIKEFSFLSNTEKQLNECSEIIKLLKEAQKK